MEKGKKEVKKVTKPAVKKETKVEIKEEKKESEKVVFTPETKKITKIISLVLSFFAAIVCMFTFIFGIITSLKVVNSTKFELLHDNFSVTFLSNINGNSIAETEDLIQGYGSKALFIIFDIALPALALVAMTIILIILLKKVLDFVNEITTDKELFTKKNLHNIEKFACLAEAIITISFVVFDKPSLLLYAFICLLLYLVIYLFKRCIKN